MYRQHLCRDPMSSTVADFSIAVTIRKAQLNVAREMHSSRLHFRRAEAEQRVRRSKPRSSRDWCGKPPASVGPCWPRPARGRGGLGVATGMHVLGIGVYSLPNDALLLRFASYPCLRCLFLGAALSATSCCSCCTYHLIARCACQGRRVEGLERYAQRVMELGASAAN